jgi:hypothetical protein
VLARRHDQRPARRCTTTGRGWPPAPQGQSCADDRSRRSAIPALATFASAEPICLLAAAIRTAIGCQRLGCSSSPLRAGVTGVSPFFFPANRLRQPCESASGLLVSWHSVGPEDAFSVVCDDGGDVIKLVQLAPLRWKKLRRIFMTDPFCGFHPRRMDRPRGRGDGPSLVQRCGSLICMGGGPDDTPRSPPSAISSADHHHPRQWCSWTNCWSRTSRPNPRRWWPSRLVAKKAEDRLISILLPSSKWPWLSMVGAIFLLISVLRTFVVLACIVAPTSPLWSPRLLWMRQQCQLLCRWCRLSSR